MAIRKKASAKKKTATRKKAATTSQKITAIREPYSKTQIIAELAEKTGLTRKEVTSVLDELGVLINRHIKKRSAGTFTLPGMFKIVTVKKPARKARKMISPFTGEEIMVKAKPATTVVKVRPLKKLKEMALS